MESDEPVRLAKCAHALWINRFLLEEHIVFDENLYEKLKLMRVLPDTMIGDVKVIYRCLLDPMIGDVPMSLCG